MKVPSSDEVNTFFQQWNLNDDSVARLVGVHKKNIRKWRKGIAKIPFAAWQLLNIIYYEDYPVVDIMRYIHKHKDEKIFYDILRHFIEKLKFDWPYHELYPIIGFLFKNLDENNLLDEWRNNLPEVDGYFFKNTGTLKNNEREFRRLTAENEQIQKRLKELSVKIDQETNDISYPS
jgi:transposase-like protein